jgi:hypothetical protein
MTGEVYTFRTDARFVLFANLKMGVFKAVFLDDLGVPGGFL